MQPTVSKSLVLTLAELEAFDSKAPAKGKVRRFLCPLAPCSGKPKDTAHRSISVDTSTGLWRCHRCGSKGQLGEYRVSGSIGANYRQRAIKRVFSLSAATSGLPLTTLQAGSTFDWQRAYTRALPIINSPGATYLRTRGVDDVLAAVSRVKYSEEWYGSPAVLFPIYELSGTLVAVSGRYLERDNPKARSGGSIKAGVFMTPGALEATPIVITEAPIDALSLAECGIPAIALCGTNWPVWLPQTAAFRHVIMAMDGDEAGDKASAALSQELISLGATAERWRPSVGKDWNELLVKMPELLRSSLLSVM